MIIRKASKTALLNDQNTTGQRRVIAHDRPEPTLATFGAAQGPQHGWLSTATWPYLAGGSGCLALYAAWSARAARAGRPQALNLSLLRDWQRLVSLNIVAVTSIVLYSVLVLAPVFLQEVQGRSAVLTGLVLLPQGVMMGVASALGNLVVKRSRERPRLAGISIVAGMGLLGVFTLGMLAVGTSTPAWQLAGILCGRGIAIGLTTQPLIFRLLGSLPRAEQADANTLFTATQRLAGSVGVALITSFFALQVRVSHSPVTSLHRTAVLLAALAAIGMLGGLWLLMRQGHRSTDLGCS